MTRSTPEIVDFPISKFPQHPAFPVFSTKRFHRCSFHSYHPPIERLSVAPADKKDSEMRSGLYLTCGLVLLGGCAQSNGLRSAENSRPDPSYHVASAPDSTPIHLTAYPGRKPQSGLGGRNPWQMTGDERTDLNLSRTGDNSTALERPAQSPSFQNSVPQIRRTNKLTAGYSAPPGGDATPRGLDTPRTFPTQPRSSRSQAFTAQHEYGGAEPLEFRRASEYPPLRNGLINPPDWNPDATPVPQAGIPGFASPSDAMSTNRIQSQNIQTSFNSGARGYSQPVLHAEYTTSITPNSTIPDREIPLRPGQSLPGFGSHVPTILRSDALQQNQHIQISPQISRNNVPRSNSPRDNAPENDAPENDLPGQQSPRDALKYLTSVTEREIATLTPGGTAAELQFYIERHVYLRLLYLMAGHTEWALRPIPNIPAADQEFWTQVLWGVHSYFDLHQVPNPAERAAQTIAQFNAAILRLKERAPLEIKNVVFSHKIEGFGEYETYLKDEFEPGKRVLVYAEIGNFYSELTAEGIYRTRLKSTLQFFPGDSKGEMIEEKIYPLTEDFCRNHRRDYFHSYVVDIPARCGKGRHVLNLVIEDELSGKTAEYPLQFNVR